MRTARSPSAAAEARPRELACRLAAHPSERARHLAIRRAVFVAEQGLFAADDADDRDGDPATLLVLGFADGRAAGAVRLYPLDGRGVWKGDRLAVLPELRHTFLGAALVRFAVATAGERGGALMRAMIQLPNVRFFEALGWRADGEVMAFHGRPHAPMAIALVGSAVTPDG